LSENERDMGHMKILRAVTFCAFTGLLYSDIPLLGWGLDDLAGYFSNAACMGYAVMVGLFSLAAGLQAFNSTEGIRGRKGEADKFVFRQRIVRVVLVLSLYIALFFIPLFDRHAIGVFDDESLVRWLGWYYLPWDFAWFLGRAWLWEGNIVRM
jgi:hypothetical protein